MPLKRAFFIDLDNTIYFTKPFADILMGPFFNFLKKLDLGIDKETFEQAKTDMLSTPFQKVADRYNFKQEAREAAIDYLKNRVVDVPIKVHDEYNYLKNLQGLKFIVTAGFTKAQLSKIDMLGIADDFEEVHVVDLTLKHETKKEVFEKIMNNYGFSADEILIIGDDAESEVKYGRELGIDTFLFDPTGRFTNVETTYHSKTLKDLETIK